MNRHRTLAAVAVAALVAACQRLDPQVEEQQIELQNQMLEAESRLTDAAAQLERLDAAITALEASLNDADRAALDLSSGEWQLYLPDLQANLANAKARVQLVRQASDALEGTVVTGTEEGQPPASEEPTF